MPSFYSLAPKSRAEVDDGGGENEGIVIAQMLLLLAFIKCFPHILLTIFTCLISCIPHKFHTKWIYTELLILRKQTALQKINLPEVTQVLNSRIRF